VIKRRRSSHQTEDLRLLPCAPRTEQHNVKFAAYRAANFTSCRRAVHLSGRDRQILEVYAESRHGGQVKVPDLIPTTMPIAPQATAVHRIQSPALAMAATSGVGQPRPWPTSRTSCQVSDSKAPLTIQARPASRSGSLTVRASGKISPASSARSR
jgi:hypothetical protein